MSDEERSDNRDAMLHYNNIGSMVFIACITIISIVISLFPTISSHDTAHKLFIFFLTFLIISLTIASVIALSGTLIRSIDDDHLKRKRHLSLLSAFVVLVGVMVLTSGFLLILPVPQDYLILIECLYVGLIIFTMWFTGIRKPLEEILTYYKK